MSTRHGTPSANEEHPGWYTTFQTDVLRSLPNAYHLHKTRAEGWGSNRQMLSVALNKALNIGSVFNWNELLLDGGCVTTPVGRTAIERNTFWEYAKIWGEKGCLFVQFEAHTQPKKIIRRRIPNSKKDWREDDGGFFIPKGWDWQNLASAKVLDALISRPELIPKEWKEGHTAFLGTLFEDRSGKLDVVSLYCDSLMARSWGRVWSYFDESFKTNGAFAYAAYVE